METAINAPFSATVIPTKDRKRLGIAVSSIPVAFLVFDTVIKLARIEAVTEAFGRMGYPQHLALGIGLLEAVCLLLYVVPRTSILGAVVLTGFLGGAISTHLRIGDPLFSHTVFPVYVAALLWAGLFLRDARVRALNPFSSTR
jgi:hypothetical protein